MPNINYPTDIKPLENGRIEVITTHLNADFDAMASMIAASKLYPGAVMVFPGSQERNIRNFFIDSVTYLFNIIKIKDLDMERVGRLILVDTRQPARIGPLEKILENDDLSIHIYDHHPDNEGDLSGEFEIVDLVGATVTILTEILKDKGLELKPEEATILALGIYEDTGSFTFISTTPRDYRAAAYLLEHGADLNIVAELTTRELTLDQLSLLNEFIESAQIHAINGVEVVITQADTEHYVDDVAVLVHKMMDMQNIRVLFALARMEGRIQMVARSRIPQVDVSEIARDLGGGGHPSAAAATIKDMALPQVIIELKRKLTSFLGPVRTARDIMAYPVIAIKPDSSLAEAKELLVRYGINTLLVIDGDVQGYVPRQSVDKALHHGMTGYTVNEFMVTEFGTVGPEATFQEIQKLIIEQKQQILPVIQDNKPVGVITRTDLLDIFTSETDVPASLINGEGETRRGRTKMILSLMRERLPREVMNFLTDIGLAADKLGYHAYAVGGFARDIMLRQENLDVDIVIEGDAIHFTNVFVQEHPEVRVRQHQKFNTAVLVFPDGLKVDVTTARLEYYEHPGALPIVEKGSIQMDLYRRDFTINTLAISLARKNFGTVIDYFRGLRDIKDGFIRVLHNLSFVEDPTRVFRAIRFEQRFGFKIGKMTVNLIHNAVKHNFFLKLSGKRLAGEIRLILNEEDPEPAVARMAEFDLLKFIQPGLAFDRNGSDLLRRIKKVRDWYQLTAFQESYSQWVLYFLGLFVHMSRNEMIEISSRLRLSKKEKRILVDEKFEADHTLGWFYRMNNHALPSEIQAKLGHLSIETILFMMAKSGREEITHAISGYFTKLRYIRPELNGRDLIAMGLPPGPKFSKILNKIKELRLNGELKSKNEEEEYVLRHYINPII